MHIGPDFGRKCSNRPRARTVVPLDGAWLGTKPHGPGRRSKPGISSTPIQSDTPIAPTLTGRTITRVSDGAVFRRVAHWMPARPP